MSGLKQKLDYLSDTKTAIKDAIVQKGVDVSDSDTFRSYPSKINEIKGASEIVKALAFSDAFPAQKGKKVALLKTGSSLAVKESYYSGIDVCVPTYGQMGCYFPQSKEVITYCNNNTSGVFPKSIVVYNQLDDGNLKFKGIFPIQGSYNSDTLNILIGNPVYDMFCNQDTDAASCSTLVYKNQISGEYKAVNPNSFVPTQNGFLGFSYDGRFCLFRDSFDSSRKTFDLIKLAFDSNGDLVTSSINKIVFPSSTFPLFSFDSLSFIQNQLDANSDLIVYDFDETGTVTQRTITGLRDSQTNIITSFASTFLTKYRSNETNAFIYWITDNVATQKEAKVLSVHFNATIYFNGMYGFNYYSNRSYSTNNPIFCYKNLKYPVASDLMWVKDYSNNDGKRYSFGKDRLYLTDTVKKTLIQPIKYKDQDIQNNTKLKNIPETQQLGMTETGVLLSPDGRRVLGEDGLYPTSPSVSGSLRYPTVFFKNGKVLGVDNKGDSNYYSPSVIKTVTPFRMRICSDMSPVVLLNDNKESFLNSTFTDNYFINGNSNTGYGSINHYINKINEDGSFVKYTAVSTIYARQQGVYFEYNNKIYFLTDVTNNTNNLYEITLIEDTKSFSAVLLGNCVINNRDQLVNSIQTKDFKYLLTSYGTYQIDFESGYNILFNPWSNVVTDLLTSGEVIYFMQCFYDKHISIITSKNNVILCKYTNNITTDLEVVSYIPCPIQGTTYEQEGGFAVFSANRTYMFRYNVDNKISSLQGMKNVTSKSDYSATSNVGIYYNDSVLTGFMTGKQATIDNIDYVEVKTTLPE